MMKFIDNYPLLVAFVMLGTLPAIHFLTQWCSANEIAGLERARICMLILSAALVVGMILGHPTLVGPICGISLVATLFHFLQIGEWIDLAKMSPEKRAAYISQRDAWQQELTRREGL